MLGVVSEPSSAIAKVSLTDTPIIVEVVRLSSDLKDWLSYGS
jgi:hypothetical protein